MNPSDDPAANPATGDSRSAGGRYRFQAGQPVDPDLGVHPELLNDAFAATPSSAIPHSPDQLIAMQNSRPGSDRPEKSGRDTPPKVKQVLDLISSLDTNAYEDQQIALALVRHLEQFHDNVVEEMQNDDDTSRGQLVGWAIDADRLMRCRMLLDSVDLD